MHSLSAGCEPSKCIVFLSWGTRNSSFLSLHSTNKTSEMSYEQISHKHSFLLFANCFTAIAGNLLTPPSLLSDCNFTFFFIKTPQCYLTFDLTASCYISKDRVQDVDMVIPCEHAAVTNMISNRRLSILKFKIKAFHGKSEPRENMASDFRPQGLSCRHKPISFIFTGFPQRIPQRQLVAFVAVSCWEGGGKKKKD